MAGRRNDVHSQRKMATPRPIDAAAPKAPSSGKELGLSRLLRLRKMSAPTEDSELDDSVMLVNVELTVSLSSKTGR